jgi:hypothetical protein
MVLINPSAIGQTGFSLVAGTGIEFAQTKAHDADILCEVGLILCMIFNCKA